MTTYCQTQRDAASHQAPHLRRIKSYTDRDSNDSDDDNDLEVSANERLLDVAVIHSDQIRHYPRSFTVQIIFAAALAALGGVLFGYDVGIVSGALLQLRHQFNLNCFQQEMVVSAMLFGALLASFIGGFLVDHIGRRTSIIVNAVIFIIGSVILTCSPNFVILIVGRFIVGFAVSLSAIAECVYISEISPPKHRGLLVSFNELGITIGFLLAYLINLAFVNTPEGWRYMFGLAIVPALLQGIGMVLLPRSPRYLMIQQQEEEARKVLVRLRGTEEVDDEITSIRESFVVQKSNTFCDVFRSKDNMRFRMLLGLGLVFLQQFTGQPNVLYYAATIFVSIGFGSDAAAMVATVGLGVAKVILTSVVLFCVDYAGRRKFLLWGTLLMAVGIACLGFVTLSQPPGISNVSCENNLPHDLITVVSTYNQTQGGVGRSPRLPRDHSLAFPFRIPATNHSHSAIPKEMKTHLKWLSFLSLVVYIAGYALGFGPVTWLILSEIFPSQIRGRAISLATVANWGTNLIISGTFLNLINSLSLAGTFLMYAAVCLISICFIFLLVPETKGQTLEMISAHLNERYLAVNIPCCHKRSDSRLNLTDDLEVENDYESLNPNTNYSLLARR